MISAVDNSEQTSSPTTQTPSNGHDGAGWRSVLDRFSPGRGNGHQSRVDGSIATVPPSGEEDSNDDIVDGIYAITKNTNYWFNRELYVLETDAKRLGAEWAERGLPHHALAATEPLPVEAALGARCGELLRGWADRVRTKMQDAIELAGQEVGNRLVAFRYHVNNLQRAILELKQQESALKELREALRDRTTFFGYHRIISNVGFWTLMVTLVVVEFIANFPVFRLLLPMNAALVAVAKEHATNAGDYGMWSGPAHFLGDLLLRPEALLLSFVVVTILVFLADTLGNSLRPVLVLRHEDNPSAAAGIRAHRRQHIGRACFSTLGIAFVLTFLFLARKQIPETAVQRVKTVEGRIKAVQGKRDQALASRSTAIGAIENELADLQDERVMLEQDQAYASTVHRSNVAILLLNAALVLAAAVAGFSHSSENLSDNLTEDPNYVEVRARVSRLQAEVLKHKQQARDSSAPVRSGISKVHHLMEANPLREWRAKAGRVEGVIPLFRSENARLRSLDPREILAFADAPAVPLPEIEESAFRLPEGFVEYANEFDELQNEFSKVSGEFQSGGAEG